MKRIDINKLVIGLLCIVAVIVIIHDSSKLALTRDWASLIAIEFYLQYKFFKK